MAITAYERDWPPSGDGVVCRTDKNSRSYFKKELGKCVLLTDAELDAWVFSGPSIPGRKNEQVMQVLPFVLAGVALYFLVK